MTQPQEKVIGYRKPGSAYSIIHQTSPYASSFRFHHHSAFEFYILLNGKVTICIENLFLDVEPNALCIYPPNSLHGLLSKTDDCPYERIFIHVEPSQLARFAIQDGGYSLLSLFQNVTDHMQLRFSLSSNEVRHIQDLALQFQTMAEDASPLTELHRISLLLDMLLIFADAVEAQKDSAPASRYINHPFIPMVLSYINDHYAEPIRLQELADLVNVSPYYLSHEFKKLTNTSVMSYVCTRRLTHAIYLMRTGSTPSDACYQSGFSNYSTFQKAFRAHFGTSPSHMEREHMLTPL